MKLRVLILLLIISASCGAQSLLSKNVTLNRKSGTVGELLGDLNSIPGIQINYSAGVVDISKKVFLGGNEKTVEDYLKTIIKGQPVQIITMDGKIFLVAKQPIKKKYTISGYITEQKSGERLIGASIYFPGKGVGTTSNFYGFYSVTLEEDSVDLHVTYSGFVPFNARINLVRDFTLNISLDASVVVNDVVIVNTESKRNSVTRAVGKTDVSANFIKSLPALMGEADVFKSLQMLPGVQAGNEGSSGLNVRGGSPDQNLILIDGVPIYNASHAFGLFSVFNADAVNNVEIIKSGFPASYGGRLSSVIDVHMKEGDKNKFHGEGGIGLVFSKLTLEGPIQKERSSFLVSARRTYVDLLLRPLFSSADAQTSFEPFFSDLNVKANFPVGHKDRIYFSLYTGKDSYTSSDRVETLPTDTVFIKNTFKNSFSWGNITALTRLNHVFSKKLFSNFTATFSKYRFRTNITEERESDVAKNQFLSRQKYFSGIQDLSLKGDFDYFPAPNHFVKMGFSSIYHFYEPGYSSFFLKDTITKVDTKVDNRGLHGTEIDFYVEDDIRFSDKLKANLGLRSGNFLVQGQLLTSLQPRANAVYRLTHNWSLKASAGLMKQYIHLLANSNLGLPTDLWLPVTDRVPPQKSVQFTLGAGYRRGSTLEASMEVYYKTMKNVIDYSEGSGFGSAYTNWEDMVELGRGRSYGVEWMLQKKQGEVTGIISYTLGKSTREFKNINNGNPFPYKYDRRHEAKTAVMWKPHKRFELAASWVFSTGNAISLPVAYYYDPFTQMNIDIYTARNNFRMPNYHRLDLSMRLIKQKKTHQRSWTFSIYNAYNQFNPFFIYKGEDLSSSTSDIVFREVAVFPIIPSFSYQFKF